MDVAFGRILRLRFEQIAGWLIKAIARVTSRGFGINGYLEGRKICKRRCTGQML